MAQPLMTAKTLLRTIAPVALPVCAAVLVFAVATSIYPGLPIAGDPVYYHWTAQRLVERGEYAYSGVPPTADTPPNASVTPGYAVFLAGIYAASGHRSGDPTSIALAVQPIIDRVQFALALCTVGLIAACGLLLEGRRLAFLSGFLAAIYLPFAWNTSVVLGETLAATLTALLLLLALLIADPKSRRGVLLLLSFGVVCAALAMIRPVMILWTPVPLAYLAVRRMESPRRLLLLAGIALAGVLLVMAPWWIRNGVQLHRFVPLADNASSNLLLSVGGLPLTPAEQAVNDAAEAQGKDSDLAVATYRIKAALERDPVGFLAMRADMVRHSVWSAWSQQINIYWGLRNTPQVVQIQVGKFAAHPSPALYNSWFLADYYHELLLVLAAGALLLTKRSPRLLIVASIPLYTIAVYAVTLFINRYFFPAMPAVVLLAAVAILWIARKTPWLRTRLPGPAQDS